MPSYLSNREVVDTTASVGVDVGARRLHLVRLDGGGNVAAAGSLPSDDLAAAVAWVGSAGSVALDAPDRWSSGPHADDQELSPKFRMARCAEIGLGRTHRIWVPWVAPARPDEAAGWIRVGVDLFAALHAAGHAPVEVYPYAIYRLLAGGRQLAPKHTAAGRGLRRDLLAAAGVTGTEPLGRSHDLLDAAAAALVARLGHQGLATPATCGHDGTAIWVPSAAAVAEAAQSTVGW